MDNTTSGKTGTVSSESPFDLKEYVEAANDAANRSRYVFIVLLVATILIFVGLNNEYMNAWWVDDIRKAYMPNDVYIEGLLDPKQGVFHPQYSENPDFKSGDFKNLPNLASKLKDEKKSLSTYLYNRFSDNTRQRLQDTSSNQSNAELAEALVKDLNNKVLNDSSLFDQDRFKGISLSEEAQELLKQNPKNDGLKQLNRMLLESAYPDEITTFRTFFRPVFIPQVSKDENDLVRPADVAKRDIQMALLRTHLESRLLIRIPILGVSIHVNDLGLIGGATLIVLLLLTRASLSREIKNLNYSFKKACEVNKLDEFYHTLAMRQLFTIPYMKGAKRNPFLSKAPYVVCLLPAIVYWSLVIYDLYTTYTIGRYKREWSYISRIVLVQWFFALIISFVVYRCLKSQSNIYYIWNSYWKWIKPESDFCLLEPDIVNDLQKYKHIVIKDSKPALSDAITAELRKAKEPTNLVYRLGRAFMDRLRGIRDFISPQKRHAEKLQGSIAQEPFLIEIDAELANLFSNDKEVNRELRKILKSDSEKDYSNAESNKAD